jgi:antitoxin (DNA-binding transcriptional repressor) of toxin-antitoxin stability system
MKSDSATNIKNNFSLYLDRVKRGETVLILEYGRPVAQISKPILAEDADTALSHLEREGFVSLPRSVALEPEKFLKGRVTLRTENSLLAELLRDRAESL